MKKIFIAFSFLPLAFFLAASAAFAATTPQTTAILQAESLKTSDLGVAEPTLLPTSPLYFLKTWRDGLRRFFTFNPVKKAELELQLTDEKIAEAQKIVQTSPERTEAVKRALENYQEARNRLKAGLEALKDTSQNPNVDKLLEKLADRAVKHEKLFAALAEKFKDGAEIKEKIDAAEKQISEDLARAARKDAADKFAEKIKKALEETPGSDLKHVASLEILDQLEENAGGELKDKLDAVKEKVARELAKNLEEFLQKNGSEATTTLKEVLENLPGDRAVRLAIFQKIKDLSGKEVDETLEDAKDELEEDMEKTGELEKRAQEALQEAEEKLKELGEKVQTGSLPQNAAELYAQAKAHLQSAQAALDGKNYGEAFGQARAAKALARNALRALDGEKEKLEKEKESEMKKGERDLEKRKKTEEEKEKPGELQKESRESESEESAQNDEAENIKTKLNAAVPDSTLTETAVEANDLGFYPSSSIVVAKGGKVKLHLKVRTDNVYYGGLDFRSDKFKTESVKPGSEGVAEFVADDSFVISSYWPLSGTKKADLRVEVK